METATGEIKIYHQSFRYASVFMRWYEHIHQYFYS